MNPTMAFAKRGIAYIAEFDCADESLLTSLHHEETRVKGLQKLRQVQSVLKERDLTNKNDELVLCNAKKTQQEQDRKKSIEKDNRILLEKLEDIHENLPKQFDMCHLSEETLHAPRFSTLKLRKQRQDSIRKENQRLRKRLINLKSNMNMKRLAADALKAEYFAEQISKVDRRRKVRDATRLISDQMVIQNAMRIPFASMHALDPAHDSLLSCAMTSASSPTQNSLLHQAHARSPGKQGSSPIKSPTKASLCNHHNNNSNSTNSLPSPSSSSTTTATSSPTKEKQSPFHALGPPPSVDKLKSPSRMQVNDGGEFFPTLKNTTKHIHSCDLPSL